MRCSDSAMGSSAMACSRSCWRSVGCSSPLTTSSAASSCGSSTSPCSVFLSSAIVLLPGDQFERLRLLRGVRVVGTRVDLELRELLAAQAVAGEHALDGEPDDLLRPALQHVVERARLEPARIAGVPVVELLLAL